MSKTSPVVMFTLLLLLAWMPGIGSGAAQMDRGGGRDGDNSSWGRRRRSADDVQKTMAKQFEEMIKYLKMDEKQEKEARVLFEARQKKTKNIMESVHDGKIESMAAQDSTREVAADYREQFNKLLTDEQRKKLEEWSRQHARGGGGFSGSGEGWDGDRPRRN